jgi:hypothetical protein
MTGAIRVVEVEMLRRGPRHNQLLSPLTNYLAVCSDFPAGQINVPYEQSDAQNLLDDLRYTVSSADDADRLNSVRDRAGAQLASMLASIPGLGGILATDHEGSVALTHLRLVISAAELALLPFELSKGLVGSGGVGEDWLQLQPDRPVCLTRHVRGVSRATEWPTEPRILFITGNDVPFQEHLDVFERVLQPFRQDTLTQVADEPRHWTSEYLTVIERATLDEVRHAAGRTRFTHVHVLAHGAEFEDRRSIRYGLSLGDRIVTGSELALALASTVDGDRHLPSVITLASCDSADQGSVVTPGGSVAHDLHASGVPLVVGSQFPISEQASIPFTETFYRGQLAGHHPLMSITDVRRQLATDFNDEHAWASVVVYEALPVNFQRRLDEVEYWQSRRMHDIALARLDAVVTSDVERVERLRDNLPPLPDDFVSPTSAEYEDLVEAVRVAAEHLPTVGPYAMECGGLRAAGSKRIAEVAYWLSRAPDASPDRRDELVSRCLGELEVALDLYSTTMRSLLTTADGRINRKVTMPWIIDQVLIMQIVLGSPIETNLLGASIAGAQLDLDHSDDEVRGWAMVSTIEQSILQLALNGPSSDAADRAMDAARDLVRAVGQDSEHVAATCRQMRRFVSWWGDNAFIEIARGFGIDRVVSWDGEFGLVATAMAVITALTPPRHAALRRRPEKVPAPPSHVESDPTGEKHKPSKAHEKRTGTLRIEMLPARNGDCIWISYGKGADKLSHVLIDCGSKEVAGMAAERVRSVPNVELFVLTHIDADHITGAIPLFQDDDVAHRFDDVWFNGWSQLRGFLGVAQGEEFSALLDRDGRKSRWNRVERADDPPAAILTDGVAHPDALLGGGMLLTVLSPNRRGLQKLAANWHTALLELNPRKAMLGGRQRPAAPASPETLDLEKLAASGPTKDASVPNYSSIALLAEFGGRAVLITGDAHADVLAASIKTLQESRGRPGERLQLDALKLSHHGSVNATTKELLDVVDCSNYLVSTDGSIFYHPDREAIARVIVHGGKHPTLHFNYRSDLNAFWENPDLQKKYGFSTKYPATGDGLVVEL